MENVVLIGYMGCGKSSVGKLLAREMKMNYLDLDDYIEMEEKLSIKDIFLQKGEIYFRKIESQYLADCLGNKTNTVLSLGGGTPCFGNNMEVVNNTCENSIYLQTSIVELTNRLFNERAKRPLIAHTATKDELQEFIGKHIFERLNYYNKAAFKVLTDSKDINAIVTEIKENIYR